MEATVCTVLYLTLLSSSKDNEYLTVWNFSVIKSFDFIHLLVLVYDDSNLKLHTVKREFSLIHIPRAVVCIFLVEKLYSFFYIHIYFLCLCLCLSLSLSRVSMANLKLYINQADLKFPKICLIVYLWVLGLKVWFSTPGNIPIPILLMSK